MEQKVYPQIDLRLNNIVSYQKMLHRLNVRHFSRFSARTRWPVKQQQFSEVITSDQYASQSLRSSQKSWTNLDNPLILISKEPYLEIFHNKILQDIVNRYKMMQGYKVHSVYGLNPYGLQVVETIQPDTNDPLEIRQKCRIYAKEAVEQYKQSCKKWGILCGPNSHYTTFGIRYFFIRGRQRL